MNHVDPQKIGRQDILGNAVSFVLPNSGIWVSLPSLRHDYENGAPEGFGYSPKIRTNYINLKSLIADEIGSPN